MLTYSVMCRVSIANFEDKCVDVNYTMGRHQLD